MNECVNEWMCVIYFVQKRIKSLKVMLTTDFNLDINP